MGTETGRCMCLKGLVTATFGSFGHSIWKNGCVVSAPSLHRESTDSMI